MALETCKTINPHNLTLVVRNDKLGGEIMVSFEKERKISDVTVPLEGETGPSSLPQGGVTCHVIHGSGTARS